MFKWKDMFFNVPLTVHKSKRERKLHVYFLHIRTINYNYLFR